MRQAVEVPNRTRSESGAASLAKSAAKSIPAPTGTPSMSLVASDVVAASGTVAQVPIRLHIRGGLPVRVAMLSVTVQPLDGSPALTGTISLNSTLGTPTLGATSGSNTISVAWLNETVTGLSGDAVLATLNVPVPAAAGSSSAYRVHVDHFSGSPNGLGVIRATAYDGIITCSDRTASSSGDSISDLWRLRWFGSATNLRSSATADPDRDGRDNLTEYQAGTNPLSASSRLALATQSGRGGIQLTFPTGLGRSYILERSPSLIGPWSPVSTNAGDGNWREVTEAPVGNVMQFYRVRAQ